MKSRLTFLALSCIALTSCDAQNNPRQNASEKLAEAHKNAARSTGALKTHGNARTVPKGAIPEVKLNDGKLYFNGHQLTFGTNANDWKRIIGAGAKCSTANEKPRWCKWDSLGLEVSGSLDTPSRVTNFTVNINRAKDEDQFDGGAIGLEGKSVEPNWLAKGVFPGYLSFDGYGIDRSTKFWELRESIPSRHKLTCGLTDCANPRGGYAPHLHIQIRLNGLSENDELQMLSLRSE